MGPAAVATGPAVAATGPASRAPEVAATGSAVAATAPAAEAMGSRHIHYIQHRTASMCTLWTRCWRCFRTMAGSCRETEAGLTGVAVAPEVGATAPEVVATAPEVGATASAAVEMGLTEEDARAARSQVAASGPPRRRSSTRRGESSLHTSGRCSSRTTRSTGPTRCCRLCRQGRWRACRSCSCRRSCSCTCCTRAHPGSRRHSNNLLRRPCRW